MTKPGSRAEFEWAEVPYPEALQGHAEVASGSTSDHPAGVIWVPDPEQRHGWREVYVSKFVAKRTSSVGFRPR